MMVEIFNAQLLHSVAQLSLAPARMIRLVSHVAVGYKRNSRRAKWKTLNT